MKVDRAASNEANHAPVIRSVRLDPAAPIAGDRVLNDVDEAFDARVVDGEGFDLPVIERDRRWAIAAGQMEHLPVIMAAPRERRLALSVPQ